MQHARVVYYSQQILFGLFELPVLMSAVTSITVTSISVFYGYWERQYENIYKLFRPCNDVTCNETGLQHMGIPSLDTPTAKHTQIPSAGSP